MSPAHADLISLREAAKLLRLPRATVRAIADRGLLQAGPPVLGLPGDPTIAFPSLLRFVRGY